MTILALDPTAVRLPNGEPGTDQHATIVLLKRSQMMNA
jgi:hypothetical protein